MSRAFIRESEDQWLSDIPPTLTALLAFLRKENNGIHIYEMSCKNDENGKELHFMSNGLTYSKDEQGKWMVLI